MIDGYFEILPSGIEDAHIPKWNESIFVDDSLSIGEMNLAGNILSQKILNEIFWKCGFFFAREIKDSLA